MAHVYKFLHHTFQDILPMDEKWKLPNGLTSSLKSSQNNFLSAPFPNKHNASTVQTPKDCLLPQENELSLCISGLSWKGFLNFKAESGEQNEFSVFALLKHQFYIAFYSAFEFFLKGENNRQIHIQWFRLNGFARPSVTKSRLFSTLEKLFSAVCSRL